MVSEFMIKRIGIPLAERLRGWPVRKYLNELDKSQWWSPAEIKELQDSKLRNLIHHAYDTVPYYRGVFESLRLTPDDVRTADDLPKLPIITKEVVRANLDKMISDRYDRKRLVSMSSSGSTGEPFKFYGSQDEKARKWGFAFRGWRWAGFEMGDRYVSITGRPHRAFKDRGKFLLRLEEKFSGMLALGALDIYQGNVDEFRKRILDFHTKMLRGYASTLYYLAQELTRRDLSVKVDCVSTTGDTLFDFQREAMESCFGCRVYDEYGGEGMVMANQCGQGQTYHVNAEGLIMEIVEEDGNKCPNGTPGQVVLTDLNRYSMPFIRYNIADVASLSDEVCECGRGLPVLSSLVGRLIDIGVTPSGKSIIVNFFSMMFRHLIPHVNGFQIVQEEPGLLVLNIVPGEDFEGVRSQILDKTQAYVGSDVEVRIVLVDRIPTTAAGKKRLFISRCGVKVAGSRSHG